MNDITDLFISVIDVLIQADNISIGCLIRLTRVNKDIRTYIIQNKLSAQMFSSKLGYKKEKSFKDICYTLYMTNRCRECGQRSCQRAITTTLRPVILCTDCQNDNYGYNELVSRKQVLNGRFVYRMWQQKKRSTQAIVRDLPYARTSTFSKILYWGHAWRKMIEK